jgi:hypothetical protein
MNFRDRSLRRARRRISRDVFFAIEETLSDIVICDSHTWLVLCTKLEIFSSLVYSSMTMRCPNERPGRLDWRDRNESSGGRRSEFLPRHSAALQNSARLLIRFQYN